MENRRTLNRTAARLFPAIIILFEATRAFGACNAPRYRIGRVLEDSASDIAIHISIRLEDFAPGKLICLAEALRQRYPGRNVTAFIFSSREAAVGWSPHPIEQTPKSFESDSKFHGCYFYDKEKHEEYLLITPDGHSQQVDSPLNTRMDLPVTGAPACRLAIGGRCLLEFEHIDYPSTEDGTKIFGRVTIAGNIQRDGAVSGLAVVDAKVNPPERQSVLVKWAVHNLGTWRFEPAKHKDRVRIRYDFEVTDSPLVGYEHNVQFRLPDEVKIWTPGAILNHFADVVSSTPSSGTGSAQAFTFVFSHPAGFSAISEAWFDIHPSSGFAPACSGYFRAATNAIYLWNDAQDEFLGPMGLNASGSLRNGSCIIDSAGSSAKGSGNNLVLTISFSFQAAFAGPKIISLSTTAGSFHSPSVPAATWTIP